MSVFLCTRDGDVVALRREDRSWAAEPVLEGAGAQCVATDGARVLVGSRGGGVHLSQDDGAKFVLEAEES